MRRISPSVCQLSAQLVDVFGKITIHFIAGNEILRVHIYNVQHNYSAQDEYSSQIGFSSKKGVIAIEKFLRSTLSYLPHQIYEDFAREHQI